MLLLMVLLVRLDKQSYRALLGEVEEVGEEIISVKISVKFCAIVSLSNEFSFC